MLEQVPSTNTPFGPPPSANSPYAPPSTNSPFGALEPPPPPAVSWADSVKQAQLDSHQAGVEAVPGLADLAAPSPATTQRVPVGKERPLWAHESLLEEKGAEPVIYAPDQDSMVYTGFKIDQPGSTIAWRDDPLTRRLNRRVLITTADGRQIYVRGDRIFTTAEDEEPAGKPASYEIGEAESMPDLIIGESWEMRGGTTAPILKVEVLDDKIPLEKLPEDVDEVYDEVQPNRFAELEKWLEGYLPTSGYAKRDIPTRTLVAEQATAAKDKTKEVAIKAGQHTKDGAKAVARGTVKITRATADKAVELREKQRVWTHEKLQTLGRFATAMSEELPDALVIDPIRNIDSEPETAFNTRRHQAHNNMLAVQGLHKAIRRAWGKRKPY